MNATKSGDEATAVQAVWASRCRSPSASPASSRPRSPTDLKEAEKPAEAGRLQAGANTRNCKESANENSVILVADVDICRRRGGGRPGGVRPQIVVPSNGNLAFAQGMVEQFAAGDDSSRCAAAPASFRPLTVVRELEAEAQKQYFGQHQGARRRGAEDDRQAAGAAEGAGRRGQVCQLMTPSSRPSSRASARPSPRRAGSSRKCARTCARTPKRLVFWTKVANIVLMPLLVALFGLLVRVRRRKEQGKSMNARARRRFWSSCWSSSAAARCCTSSQDARQRPANSDVLGRRCSRTSRPPRLPRSASSSRRPRSPFGRRTSAGSSPSAAAFRRTWPRCASSS